MKKLLCLSFLLCLCAGLIATKNANAQAIYPAATADSITIECGCLDSTGTTRACDSIFFSLRRYVTSSALVTVDSGLFTTFPATVANTRAQLIAGKDQTYSLRHVGSTTVGHYIFTTRAYGGTFGSQKLDVKSSKDIIVGAATTTNFAGVADVQRWQTVAPFGLTSQLVQTQVNQMVSGVAQQIGDTVRHYFYPFSSPFIRNPSFDFDDSVDTPTGWTKSGTATAHLTTSTLVSGKRSLLIVGSAAATRMQSSYFRLEPGFYYAGTWFKQDAGGVAHLRLLENGAVRVVIIPGVAYSDWTLLLTAAYKVTANNDSFQVDVGNISTLAADSVYFDNVTLFGPLADSSLQIRDSVFASLDTLQRFTKPTSDSLQATLDTLQRFTQRQTDSLQAVLDTLQRFTKRQTDSLQAVLDTLQRFTQRQTDSLQAVIDTLQNKTNWRIKTADSLILGNADKTGYGLTAPERGAIADSVLNRFALEQGTAQAVTVNDITLRVGASADGSFYNNTMVYIKSAGNAAAGQYRIGVGYNGTTKVYTLGRSWALTPTGTVTYAILPGDFPLVDANSRAITDVDNIRAQPLADIGKAAADTTWKGATSARSGVVSSFGHAALFNDNTTGWAQTAAGGSTDTTGIRTMMVNWGFVRKAHAITDPHDSTYTIAHGAAGSGANSLNIYCLDSATLLPIAGLTVSIRDSASGAVQAVLVSQADGKTAEPFKLNNGNYFVRANVSNFQKRYAAGTFSDTSLFGLSGDLTDTLYVVGVTLLNPPTGGQVQVYANIADLVGDSTEGATIIFEPDQQFQAVYYSSDDTTTMLFVQVQPRSAQTTKSGRWQINIYPTTKLKTQDGKSVTYKMTIKLPDGTTRVTRGVTIPNTSPLLFNYYRISATETRKWSSQ